MGRRLGKRQYDYRLQLFVCADPPQVDFSQKLPVLESVDLVVITGLNGVILGT